MRFLIIALLFYLVNGDEDVYAGLCNWVPTISFVYMSGVCLVHNGKVVMLDYCRYGKGNSSDGHDQDGYHAEVYRKKKSAFSGQGKTLVKSLSVGLPGGGHYNVDVDSSSNCENTSVGDGGIFYDVFVSGDLNASAMLQCRDWCTNISNANDTRTETQKCGSYEHDEL
ncbi:hypothetical protein EV177_005342 [Coemansia sp. RSA 1804]|nr:hypothetical protein EV177_005342 [Coemansia sp. RSA 1804]